MSEKKKTGKAVLRYSPNLCCAECGFNLLSNTESLECYNIECNMLGKKMKLPVFELEIIE